MEASVCEQLVGNHYGEELNPRSQVQCPNYYATEPHSRCTNGMK